MASHDPDDAPPPPTGPRRDPDAPAARDDGDFDFAPDAAPPRAPADDDWGVDPPADAAPPRDDWLVGAREIVTASTAIDEDTWGVQPSDTELETSRARADGPLGDPGRRSAFAIGHSNTPSSARRAAPAAHKNPITRYALIAAALAALLIGARVVMNLLAAPEPTPPTIAPPLPLTPDAAPPAPDAALAAAATDGAPQDAAVPTVTVTLAPVPADIIRLTDKTTICAAARECALPIDIDYEARAPGHRPRLISGDDLYDRRRSGRMRIVLDPLDRPARKNKR